MSFFENNNEGRVFNLKWFYSFKKFNSCGKGMYS